jgi:class 3 adenylate cyclase
MLEFYRPGQKVPFSGTGIDQTIASYFDQAGVEHLYLFDAAGREVLKGKFSSNERRGLLPLVTSLAKLKLRLTGNLIEEGYSGAVSLMDLMLEETGGAKLADIQAILKHRESTAFELKFTDRKTHFFVGQFSPPGESNKVFVMVFIIKDRNFDQLYLDLMVDKLQKEKKIGRTIQLYYGKSRFSHGRYFEKTVLKDPFFHYDYANPDSSGIGKLTEPTRFAGVSIKDSYQFSNGRRFLFYSFKLANLDAFTPVLLFNYEGISEELRVLRVLLVVIFLVTLLVLWILGRMAVRSILQPIQMLRNAVEMVEAGDYSCRLSLPGEDELVDLSRAFNSMSKGLDEREKMTRYLSKSAVAAVQSDEGAALGGRKVPATILFCDIRNFTTISESHPAETVVSLLNSYFARMNLVIEKHGGDIDKFIGDAIMAQFIVSEKDGCSAAEMALNAVKCALAMMQELEAYNRERIKANDFPIMIGVGINSGEVIAGNIGSPGRMDHTVIGDTVNVASRLEGMSKLGKHTHVIISRSTLDLVEDCIEYEQLQETAVKGKTTAVEMFEVIGCRSGVGC